MRGRGFRTTEERKEGRGPCKEERIRKSEGKMGRREGALIKKKIQFSSNTGKF
jgi:hypothetical protein